MRRTRGAFDDEGMSLHEDDLEVFETEHLASCATVVLIDVSHSMILYGEDRITPAKQAALALSELIMTRYPKDSIHVALFGDDAWEVKVRDIPYVSVGPFHTWTPDVYQGAPTPITAFMAACTKVAAFGAITRVLFVAFGDTRWEWRGVLWAVAVV